METIYFITGNNGKVANLQNKLGKYGIKVKQEKLELYEVQADDVESVSINKAKQAFDKLKKPVVVDDSGFFIDCLNGFPGVYTKYALGTLGVDGIMDIMKDKENRNCCFQSVATFIDSNGNPHVFKGVLEKGRISDNIDDIEREEAWSDLWRIFIPSGYDKTLSQLSLEERENRSIEREGESAFSKFTEWIASKNSVNK